MSKKSWVSRTILGPDTLYVESNPFMKGLWYRSASHLTRPKESRVSSEEYITDNHSANAKNIYEILKEKYSKLSKEPSFKLKLEGMKQAIPDTFRDVVKAFKHKKGGSIKYLNR